MNIVVEELGERALKSSFFDEAGVKSRFDLFPGLTAALQHCSTYLLSLDLNLNLLKHGVL